MKHSLPQNDPAPRGAFITAAADRPLSGTITKGKDFVQREIPQGVDVSAAALVYQQRRGFLFRGG